MVEPEEALEALRLLLLALQVGDEVELAVEQVLVAAAEVHERVGDVAAQGRLLDGEVEGAALHGVQGGGHVGHLVRVRTSIGATSGTTTSSPSGVSSTCWTACGRRSAAHGPRPAG